MSGLLSIVTLLLRPWANLRDWWLTRQALKVARSLSDQDRAIRETAAKAAQEWIRHDTQTKTDRITSLSPDETFARLRQYFGRNGN